MAAFQWPALPAHQQTDEQQQEGAGQHDEPQLLHRQPLVFRADVGCRHQRGEIEPFLRRDLDLRHQHRWRQRFEAQRVVGPGARQLLELDAAVEDAQIVRADELDGQVHCATQTLAQHLLHLVQHRTLARRLRQDLHLQRLVVERDEEARAAHTAQLVEHQRSVAQRQRTEVADAGRHRLRRCGRWPAALPSDWRAAVTTRSGSTGPAPAAPRAGSATACVRAASAAPAAGVAAQCADSWCGVTWVASR